MPMPYATPSPDSFKLRFPEFDDLDDGRVSYWLADASDTDVKQSDWEGKPGERAAMLYAAHNLAVQGAGASSDSDVPAGVTALRSGALSLSFDAQHVRDVASGGYASTAYGKQFLALVRAYRGGIRVTGGVWQCVAPEAYDWPGGKANGPA